MNLSTTSLFPAVLSPFRTQGISSDPLYTEDSPKSCHGHPSSPSSSRDGSPTFLSVNKLDSEIERLIAENKKDLVEAIKGMDVEDVKEAQSLLQELDCLKEEYEGMKRSEHREAKRGIRKNRKERRRRRKACKKAMSELRGLFKGMSL